MDGADTVAGDTRGYDGGKLRDGRKRHVLTDTCGLLLEVTVTAANVHDSVAAPDLLEKSMAAPGRLLKLVWADSACFPPHLQKPAQLQKAQATAPTPAHSRSKDQEKDRLRQASPQNPPRAPTKRHTPHKIN
ncbi:MAG: hypothetical protein QOI83_1625 [Streptomycetaceae bacterium]|nr:hypothetical protein [Streptomycetaceae bacterium]